MLPCRRSGRSLVSQVRVEGEGEGQDAVAWLEGPTCLTFTMTKLSTSGYFSSA